MMFKVQHLRKNSSQNEMNDKGNFIHGKSKAMFSENTRKKSIY